MKKILLTLALVLVTNTVMADWSLVDESADGSAAIYTNFDTIQKTEDKVKMWSLGDFRTVKEFSGIEFLSSKYQKEYDCKQEQARMLAFTLFSANMGEGQVVYSNSDPDEWELVARWKRCENSLGNSLREITRVNEGSYELIIHSMCVISSFF